MTFQPSVANARRDNRKKNTELSMFLGSDGGILGVGAPEVATILLVGYFILGPTELFKLTKEIGKFIQNIRTLGTEATKSFESTMENQLELQELRKAQSELNNAFSFRRSINVDKESEAFSELPPIAITKDDATAADVGAGAGVASSGIETEESLQKKKKKKKRRVKKNVPEPVPQESMDTGDIPDLDMSAAFQDEFMQGMGAGAGAGASGDEGSFGTSQSGSGEETDMEAAARLRRERMERLEAAQLRADEARSPYSNQSDWYSASESMGQETSSNAMVDSAAQSRFEAQLNGNWNQQIMANEEKLSPLAQVMERLAILEEERLAANIRLDEEFARRAEIEEKFYREKRTVLEQAAAQISAEAYSNFNLEESDTISTTTESTTVSSETTKDNQKVANSAYLNGMNSNENK